MVHISVVLSVNLFRFHIILHQIVICCLSPVDISLPYYNEQIYIRLNYWALLLKFVNIILHVIIDVLLIYQ